MKKSVMMGFVLFLLIVFLGGCQNDNALKPVQKNNSYTPEDVAAVFVNLSKIIVVNASDNVASNVTTVLNVTKSVVSLDEQVLSQTRDSEGLVKTGGYPFIVRPLFYRANVGDEVFFIVTARNDNGRPLRLEMVIKGDSGVSQHYNSLFVHRESIEDWVLDSKDLNWVIPANEVSTMVFYLKVNPMVEGHKTYNGTYVFNLQLRSDRLGSSMQDEAVNKFYLKVE